MFTSGAVKKYLKIKINSLKKFVSFFILHTLHTLKVVLIAFFEFEINDLKNGVRVVKWYEAGILSQQPGFDSCPGKNTKKYQKPSSVPLMTTSCRTYSKKKE